MEKGNGARFVDSEDFMDFHKSVFDIAASMQSYGAESILIDAERDEYGRAIGSRVSMVYRVRPVSGRESTKEPAASPPPSPTASKPCNCGHGEACSTCCPVEAAGAERLGVGLGALRGASIGPRTLAEVH